MVVTQTGQVLFMMSPTTLVLHLKQEKFYLKLLPFGDQAERGCNYCGCGCNYYVYFTLRKE